MPRAPEYDRGHVLAEAMKVFWRDGYDATSIQKLTAAMDINRGSLYQAFGSKAGLFEEVLKYYVDHFQDPVGALVANAEPAVAIRSVFYAMFLIDNPKYNSWGCLLYNTVSELTHTEPELAGRAVQYLEQLSEFFEVRIDAVQQQGKMNQNCSAAVYGKYLIALCGGLRLGEKMGVEKSALKTMIDTGIAPMLANFSAQTLNTSDNMEALHAEPVAVDFGPLNK